MLGIYETIAIVLILILLFTQNKSTVIINHNDKKNKNDNDKEKEDLQKFSSGVSHAWRLVQLCIFKMYKEDSIVDFEGIPRTINKRSRSTFQKSR
jgi:hypothetical protein